MKNLRLHVMRLRLTQQTHISYFSMINNRITNEVKTSKICLFCFFKKQKFARRARPFLFFYFLLLLFFSSSSRSSREEKNTYNNFIQHWIDIEQITFFLDRANNHHQKEDLKRE